MPTSTLFPLDAEPLKPNATRREPVIWLRRLVIVSSRSPADIIRNIEFRRGLNIIKTRQMETRGGPVAGHSVGKTLLMRLIRYTLGEPHYGSDDTQQRVTSLLKTGFVAAHWRVAGSDWVVVRPLDLEKAGESMGARDDDWQRVIDGPQQDTSYRDFLQAVNDAVLADLPTFTLPRGREAKWLDVLAWMSRDYQCGYRRANEWRHEDANSGPSLDREDNSLVMQWLMGLLSSDEIELRLKHQVLLNVRGEKKRLTERDQRRLETLEPVLRGKLKLEVDSAVNEDQQTFESVKPVKLVESKIGSFERLIKDRVAESCVKNLETERDLAFEAVAEVEAVIRGSQNTIDFLKKQIDAYERDPLKPYAKCQATPACWMRERARENAADPAASDHLDDLNEQLKERQATQAQAAQNRPPLQDAFQKAEGRLRKSQRRLADDLSGIHERIGQWKGYLADAKTYEGISRTVSRLTRSLAAADGKIEASLKVLEDVRGKRSRPRIRLSELYQQLLQRIFGPEAVGKIQVDGNGLQPAPDRKLAPAGAALSVMTTVLAFDISCVAGSVSGIGHHPRFLMHDSPREGDMEAPLFRRLFEVIHELESEFEEYDVVSFQYIVTTTTAPPSELGDESGPYVRETLDARDELGLLLKRRF